jgi:PAN domain-containing protein
MHRVFARRVSNAVSILCGQWRIRASGSRRTANKCNEKAVNRSCSRFVALLIFVVGGVALSPGARAESEQFCFDFLRSAEAQARRAEAAKCGPETTRWSADFWAGDPKELFTYCRARDRAELGNWLNQRESQLTYCEAGNRSRLGAQRPEDVRISGGPGDYTIHWTLRADACAYSYNPCWLQIRLETPPGRPGGYAVELAKYQEAGFTGVRADRYSGQPGDVLRLKWQACYKYPSPFYRSDCDGFRQILVVMPPAPPAFHPARIIALEPREYVPNRYKDDRTARADPYRSGFYTFTVRIEGTLESFEPAPFQDLQAWAPYVRLTLVDGQRTLHQTSILRAPADGTLRFEVPSSILNQLRCSAAVRQTGLCRTLDVQAESFQVWTSGPAKGLEKDMGSSRVSLRLVTGDREALGERQASAEVPERKPATLTPGQARLAGEAPANLQRPMPQERAAATVKVPAGEQPSDQARLQNAPADQRRDSTQGMARLPSPSQPTLPQQQATATQKPSNDPSAGQRAMTLKPPAGAGGAPRADTMVQAGPAQVASLGKLQQGVNLLGGDYRSQPAVATAQACQALCMGEGQCKAWTWVTAEKRCWLKSSVPVASKGNCCTSGVK